MLMPRVCCERAVVEGFEAGEHLHERGFAGSIGADEGGFFPRADEPVGFKEENARTEALAGILQREHALLFSQRRRNASLAL